MPYFAFMIEDRPDSAMFRGLAGELLARGRAIRFQARGQSMWPVIEDGEVLHIECADPRQLKRGDVVLFKQEGEFKAHRIIRKQGRRFITRGDAAMDMDGLL